MCNLKIYTCTLYIWNGKRIWSTGIHNGTTFKHTHAYKIKLLPSVMFTFLFICSSSTVVLFPRFVYVYVQQTYLYTVTFHIFAHVAVLFRLINYT
jgi:hypothetical protein